MMVERRPGLALLLSGIVPGLGQLYCARPFRGLLCFMLLVFLPLPLTVLAAVHLKAFGLVAVPILFLLLWVGVMIDAFRTAKRVKAVEAKPCIRWRVFLPLTVLSFAVSLIVPTLEPGLLRFRILSVSSASLEPEALPGDFLACRLGARGAAGASRGEVVVFEDAGRLRLGSVLALEGERPGPSGEGTVRPRTPAGCLLLRMDEPGSSAGGKGEVLVSVNTIVGRARSVFFSYERDPDLDLYLSGGASALEKFAFKVEDWKRHLTRARLGRVGKPLGP